MANKTISKSERQDPLSTSSLQSQLARIKKEEEEEVWISGEELYTEGSSDEEECDSVLQPRYKLNDNQSLHVAPARNIERRGRSPTRDEVKRKLENQTNVSKDQTNKILITTSKCRTISYKTSLSTESTESQPPPPPPTPTNPNSSENEENLAGNVSDDEDDEPTEISWKARRGTFVLPDCSNNIIEETKKC